MTAGQSRAKLLGHQQRLLYSEEQFLPYFKHFFIIVVITHLLLAAFYFAAGTLTRNVKIVYALALCFYPAFIVYQLLLKNLPEQSRVLLDPVGFNFQSKLFDPWTSSADVINQYVASYSLTAYANRVVMIIVSAACLFVVYLRFAIAERPAKVEHFSTLGLSTADQRVYYDSDSFQDRYLQLEQLYNTHARHTSQRYPFERGISGKSEQTDGGLRRRVSAASC